MLFPSEIGMDLYQIGQLILIAIISNPKYPWLNNKSYFFTHEKSNTEMLWLGRSLRSVPPALTQESRPLPPLKFCYLYHIVSKIVVEGAKQAG
jgi:hypothetical protein